MPHVGIERLGPGYAEEDTAQNKEARVAVGKQIAKANERLKGSEDGRVPFHDPQDAKAPQLTKTRSP